jgi:hydroxymethylpyrimidine/phosphomethylpyrimidine kinase
VIPRVLIIAGSDSGGGAGIQADLKTVSALGCFGMTAIAALTAQNTTGVYGVLDVDPEFVALQIDLCVSDVGCDAVKTGILFNTEIIEVVAGRIRQHSLRPLVVDPVMLAKGGAPLLKPEAIEALKTRLLPLATVVTPNLPEASVLAGRKLAGIADMKDAALAIHALGPENVVLKGGHLEGAAVDVLYDGADFTEFPGERIVTRNSHGTG